MATSTPVGYILLGKTGMGKSTTGNKLLGAYDPEDDRKKYVYKHVTAVDCGIFKETSEDKPFLESSKDSLESTTKTCHIVINEILGISVLDVPGFADSFTCAGDGVYLGNLEIIRGMIHCQANYKFGFNRVIYFLPIRYIPEKADGYLQEELKVMYHFFGDDLFSRMIIVLSNNPCDDQDMKITTTKIEQVKKVFMKALTLSTKSCLSECPPVIYISINEDGKELRRKVNTAEIITKLQLELKILDDTCINCAAKIKYIETNSIKFCKVIDPTSGKSIDYKDSKCHPVLVPKHSRIKKIVGGISIVLTFGATKFFLDAPGFFNSEEICIKCKNPPKISGCCTVNTEYKFVNDKKKSETIHVDHKNKTEKREFVEN